jgi:hypothetical protein
LFEVYLFKDPSGLLPETCCLEVATHGVAIRNAEVSRLQ